MNPEDQLNDAMIRLASGLTEEDLEDPEVAAMMAQLTSIMDPKPEPLPQEMVDQLAQIKDKAERFRQAAAVVGAFRPDLMQKLAESMKAAGLLK